MYAIALVIVCAMDKCKYQKFFEFNTKLLRSHHLPPFHFEFKCKARKFSLTLRLQLTDAVMILSCYKILLFFLQGTEFSGIHKSAVEERQRLIQLVHYQAQEIEAMKDEIMMLSRKGGHILPPAQPLMPRSAPTARPLPNLQIDLFQI